MITKEDVKEAVLAARPGWKFMIDIDDVLAFQERNPPLRRVIEVILPGGWGSQEIICIDDRDLEKTLRLLTQPDLPHIRRIAEGDRDEWILQHASDEYFQEDRILIDGMQDRVIISENPEENGAFVEAWVWVDFAETHLDRRDPMIVDPEKCRTPGCENKTDNGEGYDGYCGTCADKIERNK